MDTVLALAFFAVLIGLAVLWNKIWGAAADWMGAAINRTSQPRGYAQGKQETQHTLHFTARLPVEQFLTVLHDRLELTDGPSSTTSLYPAAHTGAGFDILAGTSLQTWFRYRVHLDPEAGRCTGTGTVTEWHQSEGMVVKRELMTRIRHTITAVAEEHGGSATTHTTEGIRS